MLPIALSLALTAVLFTALARRRGDPITDMGAMSTNWIVANRAGERNSSF